MEECSESGVPCLLLMFDINKTILIQDSAQNKDLECTLNEILSNSTFGSMCSTETPVEWKWNGIIPFNASIPIESHPQFQYISYTNYLKSKYKHNHQQIDFYKSQFTHNSQPGHGLHSYLIHLKTILSHNHQQLPIVPSFYKCIQYLIHKRYRFRILFRSFGDELKVIRDRFNGFYKGILDENDAVDCKVRSGIGFLHRSESQTELRMEDCSKMNVVRDWKGIYEECRVNNEESELLCIQDDYEYWDHGGRKSERGKLMLICEESDELCVFFDDKVGDTCGSIVDVRDVESGCEVEFDRVKDKNVFKVDPLECIVNNAYFINRIESAIDAFNNKRSLQSKSSS